MLNWIKKIFKKEKRAAVSAPEEKLAGEKGLNEEMVSVSRDLEPKESDGLAKIFEETGKEEPEDSENTEKEAEKTEENK